MNHSDIHLGRWLWIAFVVLFAAMVAAVYAPVEPIVWALPFWTVLTIVAMCASVVVAAVAAIVFGWPSDRT